MKSKAKAATVAEKARMARLKEMECLACSKKRLPMPSPVEIHHLLSGNKRRGHLFTIPLCSWHHRGHPCSYPRSFIEDVLGPSLALSSKAFRATFGTDDELLAKTNELLEKNNARRL